MVVGVMVSGSLWTHLDYVDDTENKIIYLEDKLSEAQLDKDELWSELESANELLNDSKETIVEQDQEIQELNDSNEALMSKLKKTEDKLNKKSVVLKSTVKTSSEKDVQEDVVKKPQTEEVATEVIDPSEGEEVKSTPSNSDQLIGTFEATSYAIGDGLTPSTTTANGTEVASTIYSPEGHRIIAADTNVIPMNTIVRVELPSGESFLAKVSDTGSAIQGHKIDILQSDIDTATSFGRQQGVKIYLVS